MCTVYGRIVTPMTSLSGAGSQSVAHSATCDQSVVRRECATDATDEMH